MTLALALLAISYVAIGETALTESTYQDKFWGISDAV